MSKRFFGKNSIVSNELGRWNRDIDQATKKLDKQADQVTRDVDKSIADLFGMQDGDKPSHVLNTESIHHKGAVKFFQGKETADQSTGSTVVADNSSALSTTDTTPVVAQAPVVQDTASPSSKDDTSQPVQSTTAPVETADISQLSSDTKTETTPGEPDLKALGETVTKTSLNETPTVEEENTVAKIDDNKVLVWAKTLLDHKELTKVDKQGLPHFIKTEEQVSSLTNKIFELASHEQDVSYITVATGLVTEINDFYAGNGLLG